MKNRFFLALAALLILGACNLVPAVLPTSTRIPPTSTPKRPPTVTSVPGLAARFGDRQLILDQLVVQDTEIAIPNMIEATIFFTQDGKVSGSGGCNRYSGSFENPLPGLINFGGLISTKMFCQDKMAVEIGLFQVLAKTTRYHVDNIRLILESEDGQFLARFHDLVK